MPFFEIFSSKKEIEIHETEKPIIIADHREKNSLVISELHSLGIEVEIRHLLVGDFLIGEVVIERKTVSDFINSMINKRLLRQMEEMKQYPKQLLMIEGIEEQELYNDRGEGVNGNAIRGFLLSILLKEQIPIIFTKSYDDSAKFLSVLAKKEEKEIGLRVRKKSFDKKEQKQFILEGFPGIGPKTAKKLLKRYKTIKSIINAPVAELEKEIGKKAEIFRIVDD